MSWRAAIVCCALCASCTSLDRLRSMEAQAMRLEGLVYRLHGDSAAEARALASANRAELSREVDRREKIVERVRDVSDQVPGLGEILAIGSALVGAGGYATNRITHAQRDRARRIVGEPYGDPEQRVAQRSHS